MRARVAVATEARLPDLDEDGAVLLDALRHGGTDPVPAVWDDPGTDWSRFDLVLIRSTWDYAPRRAEFLAWAARCPRVLNPLPVLAWNTDKRYLAELAAAGVPVVPTVYLSPGDSLDLPAGWDAEVVVKPTVSAGSADTGRFGAADPGVQQLVERIHREGRTVMVQPYLDRVDTEGETALLHLGGELSHAITKGALLTERGEVVDYVETITATTPDRTQLDVASAALAAVPGGAQQLAYARVDLLPGPDGPVVLELELTEPSLFLAYGATGLSRLAAAVAAAASA